MIRVFVADDEFLELEYIAKIISRRPDKYTFVGKAGDGKEALDKILSTLPDVVILDIKMPNVDGIQIARTIRSFSKETVIILNSAYAEFEYAQQAIAFQADAYLLKPTKEEEILNTIDRCYSRRLMQPEKALCPIDRTDLHLDPVHEVREYIDKNFSERLNLDTLAELVHFNPAYLSKLFSEKQGISIRDYISSKRMEQASELLRATNLPIKAIVEKSGYNTKSQFYKVFKKHFNCSPVEYRNRKRGQI